MLSNRSHTLGGEGCPVAGIKKAAQNRNISADFAAGPGQVRAGSGRTAQEQSRPVGTPQTHSNELLVPQTFAPITDGFVYFIGDGGAIKIGFSGAPRGRIRDLQIASPRKLRLLAVTPGTMADEQAVHAKFSHLRISGEWFRAEPDLITYVTEVRTRHRRLTAADRSALISRREFMSAYGKDFKATRNALTKAEKAHASLPAVVGRTWILKGLLRRAEKSPDEMERLRGMIAAVSAELDQVMRDGGEYIAANHKARRSLTAPGR